MAALVMPSLPLSSGARASVVDDVGLFSEDFAEASLLLRPRFEYRKVGDLEGANALTVRARSGLLLGKGAPVSLFAEVEATKALIDDCQSNPLGGGVNRLTRPTFDPHSRQPSYKACACRIQNKNGEFISLGT